MFWKNKQRKSLQGTQKYQIYMENESEVTEKMIRKMEDSVDKQFAEITQRISNMEDNQLEDKNTVLVAEENKQQVAGEDITNLKTEFNAKLEQSLYDIENKLSSFSTQSNNLSSILIYLAKIISELNDFPKHSELIDIFRDCSEVLEEKKILDLLPDHMNLINDYYIKHFGVEQKHLTAQNKFR